MSTRLVRSFLAVAVCVGIYVAYAHGQQPAPQPSKLDVVKVKDDLFVIHNDFVPGNVTVLVTNAGVVLVDDKFEIDHDNIVAEVKKLTNQPIKYVINTHHHGDHSGGNAKMLAMNVQVIASEQARQNMVAGQQPGMPAVTIEQKGHLHLGGKDLDLYHFGRAHTNGDVFVHFPAHRVLAAGDAFTFGDATPQLIDYAGGGSAKEWTPTLDAALMLDFDTVVPGHGLVTTKAEMKKFRDGTVTLVKRTHELNVQKKTRDEILKTLQTEFKWIPLQNRMVDGLMAETQ